MAEAQQPSTDSSAAAPRLPSWLRTPFVGGSERRRVRRLLADLRLHTVCESANCPNLCECWRQQAATFLLLGNVCTRNCRFCAVPHGAPNPVDPTEAERVAAAAVRLRLGFVVLTCVTRDDLPDGGAGHIAAAVAAVRASLPTAGIEVLTSDLGGRESAIRTVVEARPRVLNHNLETVERLTPRVRDRADYRRSLGVLAAAGRLSNGNGMKIKSGMMLGMGEGERDIRAALADLREAGVTILTLGQYMAPTAAHWPVARFVDPEEFAHWQRVGMVELGFETVVSGPLVRSSYHAAAAAGGTDHDDV